MTDVLPAEPGASEEAARLLAREKRHALMRLLAVEAMADPDFVADLRETTYAYRHVDRENWPPYDEGEPLV